MTISNLNLKEWLETLVALSVLIGLPVTLMQRYINSVVKDIRKELIYTSDKITDLIEAKLNSEISNRKDAIRHSVDEALYCLDSQIENNSMKLEQLKSSLEYLKKELGIKEQSVRDKYLSDFTYVLGLIDSIEIYLETKNGYRRRRPNNIAQTVVNHKQNLME